jgi:uncharacterized protein YcbK (DUF882 family)
MSFGTSLGIDSTSYLSYTGAKTLTPQFVGQSESVFSSSPIPMVLNETGTINYWNTHQAEMQLVFMNALNSFPVNPFSMMNWNLFNFDFKFNEPMFDSSKTDNIRPDDYSKYSKANAAKIQKLQPDMQEKTMQLLDYAKTTLGKEITINSGFRTEAEQKHLCETIPHLAVKNSPHCVGKAVDLSISGGTDEDYAKLGAYAKSIGMRWGGDFQNMEKERWHFDYNWR